MSMTKNIPRCSSRHAKRTIFIGDGSANIFYQLMDNLIQNRFSTPAWPLEDLGTHADWKVANGVPLCGAPGARFWPVRGYRPWHPCGWAQPLTEISAAL